MVNWEFFDNQTPESTIELVDALRNGQSVTPTRGLPLCTFRETSRILAGFADGRPDDGQSGAGARHPGRPARSTQEQHAGAGRANRIRNPGNDPASTENE